MLDAAGAYFAISDNTTNTMNNSLPSTPPSYYVDSLSPMSIGRMLICRQCHTHIASMDDFLSRDFIGQQSSRAGLFEAVSTRSVKLGLAQVWLMSSGAHTVRELSCACCGSYVGWKIVRAHEGLERWKNGAYVLERAFLTVRSVDEGDGLGGGYYSADDFAYGCGYGERSGLQWKLRAVNDLDATGRCARSRRKSHAVHS